MNYECMNDIRMTTNGLTEMVTATGGLQKGYGVCKSMTSQDIDDAIVQGLRKNTICDALGLRTKEFNWWNVQEPSMNSC